jgi:hypothetical protein
MGKCVETALSTAPTGRAGDSICQNGRAGSEALAIMNVYHATVRECFIPHDFNEEHPLYLLEVEDAILILFGQWMYDPHTPIAPEGVFESWNCNRFFFEKFTLKGFVERGTMSQLAVEGSCFVEARKLPPDIKFTKLREFQFVKGRGATLIGDLQNAGLIESVKLA